MKYLAVFLIAFCATFSSFGAFQYGGENSFYITETASLSVQVTGNDLFKNYNVFGYQVVSADGSTRTVEMPTANANGKKFDLGSFNTGDTVSFFVVKNGEYSTDFQLTKTDGNNHFNLEVWGANWSGATVFEIKINGGEAIAFNPADPSGGGTSPTGQPLPGILASLLIGGSVLGIARRARKKQA